MLKSKRPYEFAGQQAGKIYVQTDTIIGFAMSITNQLTLFMDIVQQGSFSKAATLHNMDNSTLSKQIKKLEATLGVRLLNRSTRSFSLTSAGEEILQQTYTLTETLTQIQNIADSYHSTPKGTLRITSPVYFGQQYLQPVVTQFLKNIPTYRLRSQWMIKSPILLPTTLISPFV